MSMPKKDIGSVETGRVIAPGMPRKQSAASPRINAPRPSVTIISEITGRITSRPRTIALNATPNRAMPTQPNSTAPPKSRPNRVRACGGEQRAEHYPFAQRKIDHTRGLVDEHEGKRDQRIDRPCQAAVDNECEKEQRL